MYTTDHSSILWPKPSQVLSDLIPLRLLPPLLLSVLTTLLADFRLGNNFYIYTLSLLLMSAISASVNILLGMVVTSIMAGILTATILMMHLLLLTPIFVNFGGFLVWVDSK